jgi:hypothetical protein
MKQEQLTDELTLIGLILALMFSIYLIISANKDINSLQDQLLEAKEVAIYLDERLEATEYELSQTQHQLSSITSLLSNFQKIEKILKDVDRAYSKPAN